MEKVHAPKYALIAVALAYNRYFNEVKKLQNDIFLPDTTELSTLWGLAQVEDVAPTFGTKHAFSGSFLDDYTREHIKPGATILFKFAPCGVLDGIKLGNPGRYVIPQWSIDGYFPTDYFNPSIKDVYEEITRTPSVQNQAAPHDNGDGVHRSQSSSFERSPISIARITPQGVF